MYKEIEGWPWLPALCPVDEQFIRYMEQIKGSKTILHMGPGLHHKVGIALCENGNTVIALTVCREEVVSRPFRVDTPNYQVFYTSLADLNMNLVPDLDIVTLFHFGEMASDFGPPTSDDIDKLLDRMNSNSRFLFYNRSAAWDRAKEIANGHKRLVHSDTFENLEVYSVDL